MTSCPVARALAAVPRRRLPPAERRAQIIEAATALLGEGGIERLSMRNIARRVGITQAAIYQHFVDKEAILFAIAEGFFNHLIEDTQRVEREVADPVERLRRSMRNYVENGLAHPDEYRLVFMTHAPGLKRQGAHRPIPGDTEIQPTKGQIAYGHMQDQVRELVASGLLREGDPEVIAEAIWAAGHGIVALLITHVDFPWSKDKLFDTQMDMLFKGLLPEGSPSRKTPG
ncbi:MAG: TetR/AcrR family transcriptional regulator [Parvibaculum sp.]|uniref:TetR/AcrR family transcriptional regulator n=1 Tax=Parvibaculum sp. TaxID=2024848 RepID=UPI0025E99348|nr:TetR/AcrR family transcriptional regulator [Parvibaculum sp.]MCE9648631.1 TetR/AcrR family transcriptional regulator [Parvibaculum sp.]